MFLRHREQLLTGGTALWFNPPGDLAWREFPAPHGCEWQTQDEMARRTLADSGLNVSLTPVPVTDQKLNSIVLSLPREKARLRLLADALADCLAPEGVLYLAGELRAGGRSAPAQLTHRFESIQKIDSARHCVLYAVRKPRASAGFRLADQLQTWTLPCAGTDALIIHSYPGVFADGSLDPGTALLLEQLDKVMRGAGGSALDLGCGAGVLGASILRRFPQWSMDMADSDALAVSASQATLERNQLEARVFASDGLNSVTDRYDLIISNPPFHAGHRERQDLGAGVFDGVGNFLKPRGQLVLVANRHLPWRRWMDSTFGGHTLLASNNRYHVLGSRY